MENLGNGRFSVSKIELIRLLRETTTLTLKEAKDAVDNYCAVYTLPVSFHNKLWDLQMELSHINADDLEKGDIARAEIRRKLLL